MPFYKFPNHNPKVTLEEFARDYIKESGKSREFISKYKVIVPCDCDWGGCRGWGAVPRAFAHEDYEPQDIHEWPEEPGGRSG